jgi:hypothetical protein
MTMRSSILDRSAHKDSIILFLYFYDFSTICYGFSKFAQISGIEMNP